MAKLRRRKGKNPNSKDGFLGYISRSLRDRGVDYRHIHLSYYGGISNVMVVFKQQNNIDDMERGIRALQEIVTEKYSKLCVVQSPGTDRTFEISCEVI